MFEHTSALEAAKWAALVFAAGFIGFFGKALGRAFLSLFNKKSHDLSVTSEAPPQNPSEWSAPSSGAGQARQGRDPASKDGLKAVKKEQKALLKAMKKAGKD